MQSRVCTNYTNEYYIFTLRIPVNTKIYATVPNAKTNSYPRRILQNRATTSPIYGSPLSELGCEWVLAPARCKGVRSLDSNPIKAFTYHTQFHNVHKLHRNTSHLGSTVDSWLFLGIICPYAVGISKWTVLNWLSKTRYSTEETRSLLLAHPR